MQMSILGRVSFDTLYPCQFQQSTPGGVDWNGIAPSNLKNQNGSSPSAYLDRGSYIVPADIEDENGGLFDFGHTKPINVKSIVLTIPAGMSWTLKIVRKDGSEDQMLEGNTAGTILEKEFIILQPGEKFKLESSGNSGSNVSKCVFTTSIYESE